MEQRSRPDHASSLLFAGIATGVYAVSFAIVGRVSDFERPGAATVAMTIDMVVVVPIAFYALVVRRRGFSIVTLAPVLILSVVGATQILPRDHQQALRALEPLIALLELGLIGWIGWRAARAIRRARCDPGADPLDQLHRAAHELLRHDRAAAILASEIAVFYYAIGAWRARAHAPADTQAFTHHRRGVHSGIVIAGLMVIAVEGLVVHFLLALWSVLGA